MKGYFVTEAQVADLKERLELPKLRRQYLGKKSLKKPIEAATTCLHKEVLAQVEAWIKQISKD